MKAIIAILVLITYFVATSCTNKADVKHIELLTEIWGDTVNGKYWENRDDYFIIYNSWLSNGTQEEIERTIKPYADSFSRKFSNYTIFVYTKSGNADTNYIKKFGKGYYYKALQHEKPYMTLIWWGGKFLEDKSNLQ